MADKDKSPTTMAVLKMMGVVNPDGSTKIVTGTTTVPATAPLTGAVDDVLTLSKVYERLQILRPTVKSQDDLMAMRARVEAGPDKIKAAGEAGATVQQIQAATIKLAELDDQLAESSKVAARLYLLNVAYSVARDFRAKAANTLGSALSEAGGDITVNVPGVVTFRLDLAGPDDEPPF